MKLRNKNIIQIAKDAKKTSVELNKLSTKDKNKILLNIIKSLDKNRNEILEANKIDVDNAKNNIKISLLDRLILNNQRIDNMIDSLKILIDLKDHIGEIIDEKTLKNGLKLIKKRVPFGVIGVIYESRPNVTIDVASICLKSSSSVILKGGSEAINTNKILVKLLNDSCQIKNAFQLIESTDRSITNEILKLNNYIDLIIPRGGKNLINFVRDNSKVPIIETGTGNCHIFLDEKYDIKKAIKIIINAKTQRPSVCNAVEKLLIHENTFGNNIKSIINELKKKNVEIRGCNKINEIEKCKIADETDWHTEYLDLIMGIKIVKNVNEAISHINKYGTKHSEAILSYNNENIDKFNNEVDASTVYTNASTRFTDGYEFGMGAEIGISTQKLHARGPMGLEALSTYKYLITGNGHIRK
ncbi:glutamate-5-semialdehyde dehydrogenase [archaeon]|jgi:glutamate-5-semialdehyde dehydrogenase|nr:glutamate-5-semialdehyde dehydrogenase [archaeon]MBT4648080.1 glutamate-5-semialdehyde dehydrogenase [archaeon]MBT6822518.1 glutamate-5-semialdehyde dehydrogenase [archaeon]MBT7392519.1 glutamate-5-semialdehyde dehydrogenase [archaeon]